jgi:hypothetical protein
MIRISGRRLPSRIRSPGSISVLDFCLQSALWCRTSLSTHRGFMHKLAADCHPGLGKGRVQKAGISQSGATSAPFIRFYAGKKLLKCSFGCISDFSRMHATDSVSALVVNQSASDKLEAMGVLDKSSSLQDPIRKNNKIVGVFRTIITVLSPIPLNRWYYRSIRYQLHGDSYWRRVCRADARHSQISLAAPRAGVPVQP